MPISDDTIAENDDQKPEVKKDEEKEEIDLFEKWCEEEPPSGIPDFIRPEALPRNRGSQQQKQTNARSSSSGGNGSASSSSAASMGEPEGIFRHGHGFNRSRMFVNQKFSNKKQQQGKGRKDFESSEDTVVTSWDKPIHPESPKVYLANKEFELALRTDRPSDNSDVTECSHLVVHTSCHCCQDSIMGVCVKCYLVFCESSCLHSGLSSGKIASSSKSQLESNFGRSAAAAATTKDPEQVALPKPLLSNGVKPIPPLLGHPAFRDPQTQVVPPTATMPEVVMPKKDKAAAAAVKYSPESAKSKNNTVPAAAQYTNKRAINEGTRYKENYHDQKSTRPGRIINNSAVSSSSSSSSSKPPAYGLFRSNSGYQEGFQELPRTRTCTMRSLDTFELELGGQGLIDDVNVNLPASDMRGAYDDGDQNAEFYGAPRGRGRGMHRGNVRPFMTERIPRNNNNFGGNEGKVLRVNFGPPDRIIRDDPYLLPNTNDRVMRESFGPLDRILRGNGCPPGKILRDPRRAGHREQSPPPVYRGGKGRGVLKDQEKNGYE